MALGCTVYARKGAQTQVGLIHGLVAPVQRSAQPIRSFVKILLPLVSLFVGTLLLRMVTIIHKLVLP